MGVGSPTSNRKEQRISFRSVEKTKVRHPHVIILRKALSFTEKKQNSLDKCRASSDNAILIVHLSFPARQINVYRCVSAEDAAFSRAG